MMAQLEAELGRYAGIEPGDSSKEKVSKYGRFIGDAIDDAFAFSAENKLRLVSSLLDVDITKRVNELKENLFALKSLPDTSYLSLLQEETAIRTLELTASPTWREVRTKPIDWIAGKLVQSISGKYHLAILATDLNPKQTFTHYFDREFGNWLNFFCIGVEETELYTPALALSNYLDFLTQELANAKPFPIGGEKNGKLDVASFDTYITKAKEKVLGFMQEMMGGQPPKRVVALLFALKELGLVKTTMFDNQSALYRSLTMSFDYQGTRAAISQNIKLYNFASEAEKSMIEHYKQLINSRLSSLT